MKRLYTIVAAALMAMAATTSAVAADKSKLSPQLVQIVNSHAAMARHHGGVALADGTAPVTDDVAVRADGTAPVTDGGAVRADNTVGSATIDVLLKLTVDASRDAVLQAYDGVLLGEVGRVLIVRLPLRQVGAMSDDSRVVRIEAERTPRPMLDMVPQQVGADKVVAGTELPHAFTGEGVVVGIVDSGFDYIHPFFRDGEGKTRVTWAADYLTGQKAVGTEAVTAALHGSDAATMYHGTHVAGIAAGSRVNDINDVFYQGIATGADIAEATINSVIGTDGSGLSSATSLQAFNDIFAWAKEQGKPCVINYSLGDAMSFADNRQLEEEGIRTLLQEPGRALVVSSGNSGGSARLAHKPADMTAGGAGIIFNDIDQYGTYFGIELKVKSGQSVTLRHTNSSYTTTKGELTLTAEELVQTTSATLGSKRLTVLLREQEADGYAVVYITAGMGTYTTSDRLLVTIEGAGDAWLYADPLCAPLENVAGVEGHQLAADGYSMTWPAEMDEVVAVGNIAHRLKIVTMANKYASQGGVVTPTDLTAYESTKGEGYLAKSSSVGPTLRGTVKPDVCAPGVNIVSAQGFFINDDTYYATAAWDMAALDTEYEEWGGLGGYFHMMAQTGTSMSAPVVTGTIALWMEADPTLTTERIKDVIAHSSRQPDADLSYPNSQYGHGEIDAYRGLLYIIDPTGIINVSRHQPRQAAFHLSGRQLSVDFDSDAQHDKTVLTIYATDGRMLLRQQGTAIDLSRLPQGVYAVQLTTGSSSTTGSTLIRLK